MHLPSTHVLTSAAQRNEDVAPTLGACLHTGTLPTHPHGQVLTAREYDADKLKRVQREARLKSALPSERVGYLEKDTRYVTV